MWGTTILMLVVFVPLIAYLNIKKEQAMKKKLGPKKYEEYRKKERKRYENSHVHYTITRGFTLDLNKQSNISSGHSDDD